MEPPYVGCYEIDFGYAISSPRMVPVAEANLSVSRPIRCSIETKRFGSG